MFAPSAFSSLIFLRSVLCDRLIFQFVGNSLCVKLLINNDKKCETIIFYGLYFVCFCGFLFMDYFNIHEFVTSGFVTSRFVYLKP